jgi:hypothetical protein
MARIFITGSSDGLGSWTGQRLVKQGHRVVLHAQKTRSPRVPAQRPCSSDNLSSREETASLAKQANKLGASGAPLRCDHSQRSPRQGGGFRQDGGRPAGLDRDGAPYILTCLINRPVARKWSDVTSNALDPGWVGTKMGGAGAHGSKTAAVDTYKMLALGDAYGLADRTGKYFNAGKRETSPNREVDDVEL